MNSLGGYHRWSGLIQDALELQLCEYIPETLIIGVVNQLSYITNWAPQHHLPCGVRLDRCCDKSGTI